MLCIDELRENEVIDFVDPVNDEKKKLREVMLARQKSLSADYVKAAGDSIQAQVLSSAIYRNAGSIFTYISLPREPSTDRIIRQAFADGKQVYVPKCVNGRMLAVRIGDLRRLRSGAYGIPEPVDCTETRTADELDLIIVPCVAASPEGRRLGHGAGYYDRFLGGTAGKTVCLCFRQMLCDSIPMADCDVYMAHVISEQA